MLMDIVDEVFIYDSPNISLQKIYKDYNIDIKKLSKVLPSNRVCEDVDSNIEVLISQIISLKKILKTPKKVKEYIRAVLIETEQNKKI